MNKFVCSSALLLLAAWCCGLADANNHGGFGPSQPPPSHHGPPGPRPPRHNNGNALPRYYDHGPPPPPRSIIASPKPKQVGFPHPSQFMGARAGRSDKSQQSPQLIASASNTPVLVLKKEVSRPVLSSAVAKSESKQQQQQQQHQLPIVVLPPPSQPPSQPKREQQQEPQASAPKPSLHHQVSSMEHDLMSEEENESLSRSASAERRMFFESVAANSGHTDRQDRHDEPRIEVRPITQPIAPPKQARAAGPGPRPRPERINRHDDDEDDERMERIVRSNSNNNPHPYNGGQFEYPPPQSNYIAHGPTRVPVKYQAGVIGLKQDRGKHRPYKQRIQQAQHELSGERLEGDSELEEEEEEEAVPDRLTELLATSKFACGGKKDGYYADDSLNCEVFHYCQDGGKHSWLCPNGFAFHQIHLICVPPSSDNICKQSSDFHFVNEYLYRPINEKEAEGTNISLKYADRYFPDGYNHGAGDVLLPYDDGEEDDQREHRIRPQQPQQHHAQQQYGHHPHQHQQQQPPRRHHPHQQQQHHAPSSHHHSQHPSSYSSHPSFVHQPHGPPRPTPQTHTGFLPSPSPSSAPHRIPLVNHHSPQSHPRVIPQSALHGYAQQRSGSQVSPTIIPQQPVHNKHGSSSSQSSSKHMHGNSNPNVFFSPETINIPLNQRRPIPNPHAAHHPQIFRPSPQVASSRSSSSTKHSQQSASHPQQSQAQQSSSSRKHKYDEYEDEEY